MNTSESLPPSPSAPLRLLHVPRFSIRYLLAWTALTAAALVMLTQGLNLNRTLNLNSSDPLYGAIVVIAAMVLGWLYFGTLLIIWHSLTETLWPLEPGEWLILAATNAVTLWLALAISDRHPYWLDISPRRPFFHGILYVAPTLCAAVCLVAAIAQRQQRPWSTLFMMLAMLCLSFYGIVIDEHSMAILIGLLLFATAASLIYAVLIDLNLRKSRCWLHQSAGVLLLLGTICFLAGAFASG